MELVGRGVTSCATCDGAFYPDVPVAVIGGGDSACEEATFLTKFASKVYLIHRRDELRASRIMADRALGNAKVEPVWNSEVKEYLTDEKGDVRAVTLYNKQTGEDSELEVKCVFVAIGHDPNTGFLEGSGVELDDDGYVVQNGHDTKSNIEGLYSAGDVSDHVYRQAITAAGNGCQAALDAERYLAAKGD
jgi:thioredoxin reductase (NADPH)